MKTFFVVFGSLILIIIGGAGLWFVGTAIRAVMIAPRVIDRTLGTVEGVVDKTLTADNAIYNYEYFRQTIEDIKALKNKIDIANQAAASFERAAGPRKDWSFEDKTEDARLHTVAQGLQSQLEDVVATYNARSKMATRSIFLDGKIPSVLEIGAGFLK